MTERAMREGDLRTLIQRAAQDACESGTRTAGRGIYWLIGEYVLAVLRPHLVGVTGDGEPYRPVAEMTLWELAQAIAINSDVATNLWVETAETEEEEEANRAKAMRYFDRRNECVGEIRDREQAIVGRGEG